MKKRWVLALVMIGLFLVGSVSAYAAARDEVIDYCKQAATLIKNKGIEAGVKQIGDSKGPFIWNNGINYVFLMNMKGRMLAHPYQPDLTKVNLLEQADKDGKRFFNEFIEKASKGRGRVKYKWPLPKTGEILPKYTYVYRVPGTDYIVASGFYVLGAGVYH